MGLRHWIGLRWLVATLALGAASASPGSAAMVRTTIAGTNLTTFSGMTIVLPPPPPLPESVPNPPAEVAVGSRTTHSLLLGFADRSDVERGYRIDRRANGGAWVTVAQLPSTTFRGTTSWKATGLAHDTQYCFRVVPWNDFGSPAVREACARTNRLIGTKRVVVTDRDGLVSELLEPTTPPFQWSALVASASDGSGASAPAPTPPYSVPPSVKEIYVADDAVIDLSYRELRIPAGITLLSGRGGLRQGAILYTTATDRRTTMLEVTGDNVRISGLRFRGPSASISQDNEKANAIRVHDARDVVIDGNEFYWWPGAGVEVRHELGLLNPLTAHRVRVVGNFFHHNQRQDAGYGVVVADASYTWIEKNTFDWNRHAIASDGGRNRIVEGYGPEHGYLAYQNLVLPGHADQEYAWGVIDRQTHHFDVHGSESNWLGVDYYDGWAGEFFDVADNSFLGILGTAFNVRGTPSNAAHFRNNVLPPARPIPNTTHVPGLDGGVSYYGWYSVNSESDRDNVYATGNRPLPDPRQRFAVGDFDGDGRDDVFLATGAAWYVSYGGVTEWRWLNQSTLPLSSLSFADVDGDRRTDVLTRVGATWQMSRSGTASFARLPTAPVLPPQSFYSGSDLVGDFSGDDVLDRLRFDRTGDRYFRTVDGRRGTTTRSWHQM